MVAPVPEREETLGQFLASRARHTSDVRLAGDAIAAVLTAIAIAFWRGPVWDVRISIAVCLLAFGMWGIADRDLARSVGAPRSVVAMLRATRIVAAALGFAAAAYLMVSLLGRAIGPVIS